MIGFDQLKTWAKKNMENGCYGNIKTMNGIFATKTLGAMDLKLGKHIQLHTGSNIGWVPPGHTCSFSCVRLKIAKMVYQQIHLNLRS